MYDFINNHNASFTKLEIYIYETNIDDRLCIRHGKRKQKIG